MQTRYKTERYKGRWRPITNNDLILDFEFLESGTVYIFEDKTKKGLLDRAIDNTLKEIDLKQKFERKKLKK